MKFYVTKWCLTNGIEEWECEEPKNGMIQEDSSKGMWSKYAHKEGRDWHRTHEQAVIKAGEMKLKKIQSLKQSIKRLEQLRFDQDQKNAIA